MKVIASHNGLKATRRAWGLLEAGAGAVDACVDCVTAVEDDPDDLTVGYGGLPNADGVVELDAAVMDGRTHRGGAVAGLRGVRHATRVARLVMQQTGRVMLVGEGALKFARANGFVEENLLSDRPRQMWLYWLRTKSKTDDWRPPAEGEAGLDVEQYFRDHFYGRGGTVHCAALDQSGDLACATSTSGHAFKMPGRVGDSPILGAGLYVDNEIGSCGAIGHGEASMQNLSSYAVVELMRGGMSPKEAALETLRRVAHKTAPEACDGEGRPKFNLQLYVISREGAHAGAAIWGPKHIAVTDADGTRLEDCAALFTRT